MRSNPSAIRLQAALLPLALLALPAPAQAQDDVMQAIVEPAQPDAIALGTGPLAGAEIGMYQKATTSTGWFEAFADWLRMHGFLDRTG
jgi:hypothetical protein